VCRLGIGGKACEGLLGEGDVELGKIALWDTPLGRGDQEEHESVIEGLGELDFNATSALSFGWSRHEWGGSGAGGIWVLCPGSG
jgi:hypothetical protein